VDAAYAYRFGDPQHDAIVVSLERDGELLSQAFRFPVGFPTEAVEAEVSATWGGNCVRVASDRLLYGVRIHAPGLVSSDDAFCVEPGRVRTVAVTGTARDEVGEITAVNLSGGIRITSQG
jgi:hypothetical protein